MPLPPGIDEGELPERDDFVERFPRREWYQRGLDKREAERKAARRAAAAQVEGQTVPCEGLRAEERLNCPLSAAGLTAIDAIPRGARLRYLPDAIDVVRVQQILVCQVAAAGAPSPTAPACGFLTPDTRAVASDTKAGLAVELTEPTSDDGSVLRARLRNVFDFDLPAAHGQGLRDQEEPPSAKPRK